MRTPSLISLVLALACSGGPGPVTGPAPPVLGAPVPAGPLAGPTAFGDYLIILPAGGDIAGLEASARAQLGQCGIPLVDGPPDAPTGLAAHVETGPAADAVTAELLDYFGVGLTGADRAGLTGAKDALFLSVDGPTARSADVQHAGAELASELAAEGHGWVQDQWTEETFTTASFAAARPTGFPMTSDLLVVHAVRDDGGGIFLETRGLGRFGDPELFLRNVPQTHGPRLMDLMKAAAQTVIEKGGPDGDGQLTVDLGALTTPPWPERAAAVRAAGGTGRIALGAVWSDGDGEPDPLVELELPGTGDVAARAYDALRVYGDPEASAVLVPDTDPALLAARDRARAAFALLAPHFASGVPELERLVVKSSFPTDDGKVEWMWVEVRSWRGDTLSGVLVDDPIGRAKVRAGDHVEVQAAEIFDYVWDHADGTHEGGETNAILAGR